MNISEIQREEREALLHYFQVICRQIELMVHHGEDPTWDNFSQTDGWAEIRKDFGETGQENYKKMWGQALELREKDPGGFFRVVNGKTNAKK